MPPIPPPSYPWPSGILPSQGLGSQWCWLSRVPRFGTQTFSTRVSLHITTAVDRFSQSAQSRSREWVCPKCQQTNLESLPDPPQHATPGLSDSATLRGPSRAQDQFEPPVLQSLLPTTPQRSCSGSETNTPDLDPAARSRPVAGLAPSITEERESPIPSRIEANRGSLPAIRRRSHRPPFLLDTAICVLLVLVVALFLRRVV